MAQSTLEEAIAEMMAPAWMESARHDGIELTLDEARHQIVLVLGGARTQIEVAQVPAGVVLRTRRPSQR